MAPVCISDTRCQALLCGDLLSEEETSRPPRICRSFGTNRRSLAHGLRKTPGGGGTAHFSSEGESAASGHGKDLSPEVLEKAVAQLRASYDSLWGGFGSEPKFPTPHHLTFLLRWFKRRREPDLLAMVEKTLKAMWQGGPFDQIGFRFHRYSVDAQWKVPHFEKMLYDQALIMEAASECYQVTGDPMYTSIIHQVFTYVTREMRHPGGGFYSAQDADSEGGEGLYYLWRPDEIRDVLGKEEGELICRFLDITPEGNFENRQSIPRVSVSLEEFGRREGFSADALRSIVERAKSRLFETRAHRAPPLKDDKILTSWNGLMIAALAFTARATGQDVYLSTAKAAAGFLLETAIRGDCLFHRYREGEVAIEGMLEDYAYLVWSLLELYETDFDTGMLSQAISWTDRMISQFWDEMEGGFYLTVSGTGLPVRTQAVYDGAIPSANSLALSNLLRLGHMTGDVRYHELADRLIRRFGGPVASHPMGYTHFLNGLLLALGPSREIVVTGELSDGKVREILSEIRRVYLPEAVTILKHPSDREITNLCPYLVKYPVEETPALYICEGSACREPIHDLSSVKRVLDTL